MSEKHILCGFDVPEFEKRMKALLKEKGIEATTYIQLSKKGVKDFIDQNPKCDTVILLEASNLKKSYTAEEIAALTDKRDINVIVVLSSRHIGTDYMKTLYVAGVTNAIFQMGRNDGASAKDIVELVLNKRNRLEARKYYGIEHLDLDPTVMMDRDSYTECMERLHKDENLLLNYLQICSDMSPKQIADFTKRMPADDRQYLAQYEEFHQLIEALKKMGVVIKVKRPKKTKIGLNVTPQISVNEDALTFVNNEELFHMQPQVAPVKDTVKEEGKENVVAKAITKPAVTEDMFAGMSMEELLLAAESDELFAVESVQTVSGPDEVSKAALEEAKRLEEEALEAQRKLAMEQEKFENERKAFEQSKKEAQKELQKEEKRLQNKAQEVEKQAQKTKAEEEKARKRREKEAREEIERRRREEADRVRRKELEKADEEEDEDAELFTSEKQFSGSFLVFLLLLCLLVVGALFAMPYLQQFEIF